MDLLADVGDEVESGNQPIIRELQLHPLRNVTEGDYFQIGQGGFGEIAFVQLENLPSFLGNSLRSNLQVFIQNGHRNVQIAS